MVQRKLDLLFWGYIASVLHSVLKPYYEKGMYPTLSSEDRKIIDQSKGLLDSMLEGCDAIFSLDKLSFTDSHTKLPSATALNLAIEIFSSMVVPIPNDIDELKNKLKEYRRILEKLETSAPMVNNEPLIAQETASFFKVLGDKADQESYETAYSL